MRQSARFLRRGHRLDQPRRQVPLPHQRRTELDVVEAQRVPLERRQVRPLVNHAGEQLHIRRTELAQHHQDADVLHHPGDERLVARFAPELGRQLPGGDGPRERRPPVPLQLFGGNFGEQLIRQTESERQELQRLVAENAQRLIQIGHFPPQPEERAVHHAQDLAGQRRILLQQLLQQPRIDMRLLGQTDDFQGHRRAGCKAPQRGQRSAQRGK